ncbi:hypothetical protein SAMN05421736_105170 [Evansella caseinilytica]|uniref:LPXTG-motif cell wall-anchored protein n=1 Tax=Evansella caseinilytica TaxID=1503961 RepID=A0A1H3PTE0_9BACI|nr:hypothetical protein [Evansella caseinilytica]SDZ03669.1 hypothetical protein SAMN05421736_105170 [Evansella caseinilytica]
MIKKALVILSVVILSFALTVPATFAASMKKAEVPEKIQQFAKTSGIELFKASAASDPEGFGFADKEELNQIQLGDGFPVYFVDYEKLKKDPLIKRLGEMLKPAETWRFFITVNGKPKSFLLVGYQNGDLTVLEYGGNASELGKAYEQVKNAGYDEILLLEDENTKYFVTTKADQVFVIPDVSENHLSTYEMDNEQMWSSEKLVEKIKNAPILSESYEDDGTVGGSSGGRSEETNSFPLMQPFVISFAAAIVITILFIAGKKRIRKHPL